MARRLSRCKKKQFEPDPSPTPMSLMEAAISQGKCDAVSAGRAFIADPYFYRHIRDNQPGPHCVDCNACVGHLGAQPAECYHPIVKAEKAAMLAREGI